MRPQSNDYKELDSASKLSEHGSMVYRTLREHRCWPPRIKIYGIVHNAVKAIELLITFLLWEEWKIQRTKDNSPVRSR